MGYSLNHVVLIGKVGKDAEVKEIKDGVKVANFSVATSTGGYKKTDGTEVPQQTQWHAVQCWRGLAELASKCIKKGATVSVVGSINYRDYEDKNGAKKSVTEIIANELIILSTPQEKINENAQKPTQKPKEQPKPITDSDDLPF